MSDDRNAGAAAPREAFDLRHHTDDAEQTARLAAWLSDRVGAPATISGVDDDIANGMSSSTLLFDMDWVADGTPHHAALVARIAPDPDDVAVFPDYDLAAQFHTMQAVADHSDTPMPTVRWLEETGEAIGRPFFVMDRISGQVPPDMLPYTFGDNWLADATDDERADLQHAMVRVLAQLHAIEATTQSFGDLVGDGAPGGYLRRHLARTHAWYDWSVADTGVRSPLVETALAQLDAAVPDEPAESVLSWGDARIGNVLFAGYSPAAVLDWEMADVGPRELDVVWLCYSHRVFQDLAEGLDLVGLPGFLRIDDTVRAYGSESGHAVRDLDWHLQYAAVRWACAFLRTGAREAHLNHTPLTDDGDALLHNRTSLTALVDGTFDY